MTIKKASFYLFLLYLGVFVFGICFQFIRPFLGQVSVDQLLMWNKLFLSLVLLVVVYSLRIQRQCGLIFRSNWSTLRLYWPFLIIGLGALAGGVNLDVSFSTLFVILVTMLAVGLNEELMFRGMVFYWFKNVSARKTILISALSFGSLHLLGLFSPINPGIILAQVYFAAGLGVIFAYARSRDYSIMIPILVHAVFNFVIAGAKGGVAAAAVSGSPEQIIGGLIVLGTIAWLCGMYLLLKGDFEALEASSAPELQANQIANPR